MEGNVSSLAGNADLGLGAENNGANPFPGDIDDFRLYGAALTDEQVLAIYNEGMGDLTDPPPFEISNIRREGDSVTLTFRSRPGRAYAIDASPDLLNWDEELDDNVVGEADSDTTQFTESTVPDGTKRFYRVREL